MSKIAREDFASVGLVASGPNFDMMADVRAFHEKFGQAYDGKARMLPNELYQFRRKFHEEELEEYNTEQEVLHDIVDASSLFRDDLRDRAIQALENQLDALVDAVWVILGTAEQQFGEERFKEAWRRVVVANMGKVRAGEVEGSTETGRNPNFDIVKPPGWTPPSHRDLVEDHEPL
jgi:predicted HAD superfamily Cof-like phosphohydrolase